MRILLITTSYPESADGREAAGSFVADFAEALADRAEVAVVAPGTDAKVDRNGPVVTHRFSAPVQPLSLLSASNPGHWPAITRILQAGKSATREAADQLDPDHLFALWALPSGYWARAVARERGTRYSTWALGSDIWSLGKFPVVRKVLRDVLAEASIRFADGFELAHDVERISGRDCRFLPSVRRLPVVERERQAAGPPYRLAFLGRWHENKGIDLLMDSLKLLREPDWSAIEEVRVFGGGPFEDHVHSWAVAMENANRPVTVGGYLDSREAAALYAWADYLILPSRIESIPVLFSDAVQARCPLIATPVGDLPRLMENYRIGILAPEVTAAGIGEAIRQSLTRSPADFAPALDKAADDFSVRSAVESFLAASTMEAKLGDR